MVSLLVAIGGNQPHGGFGDGFTRLFDTLAQELPPTLEAIRLTGGEIADLTEEVSGGVQSAAEVIKQVDQGILVAKTQAQKLHANTRGLAVGLRAAWNILRSPKGEAIPTPQAQPAITQPTITKEPRAEDVPPESLAPEKGAENGSGQHLLSRH